MQHNKLHTHIRLNYYGYEVMEGKVSCISKNLHTYHQGTVFFEDLGHRTVVMKRGEIAFLLIAIFSLLISLIMLIFFNADYFLDRIIYSAGLGICSTFFFVLYYNNVAKYIKVYDGNINLLVFYNDDNEVEAQKFVDNLIQSKNAFLLEKFNSMEANLLHDDRVSWIKYLNYHKIIPDTEMKLLIDRGSNYRNENQIGFKIPTKADNETK